MMGKRRGSKERERKIGLEWEIGIKGEGREAGKGEERLEKN